MQEQNVDNYVSRFKIVDTRYLMFRDLPEIIQKYVKGTKALDYGCGPAQSTLYLKSLGLEVDGVDISEQAIEYAKKEDPNGKYTLIKSGELPFGNNCYDLVFASAVFAHTETKQELHRIFQEIVRVLKVGGTFILLEFNRETYNNRKFISFHTRFEENQDISSGCNVKIKFVDNDRVGNHYFWSDEDFVDCMRKAGLTFVKTHNPIGKNSDDYEWLDEKDTSPCTIYIAQKQSVYRLF